MLSPNAYIKASPCQFQLSAGCPDHYGPLPVGPAYLAGFLTRGLRGLTGSLTGFLLRRSCSRFLRRSCIRFHFRSQARRPENTLPEGNLIAFRCPGTVLAQAHGDCHGILRSLSPGCCLRRDLIDFFQDRAGKDIFLLCKRRNRGLQKSLRRLMPFPVQTDDALVPVRARKEAVIHDTDTVFFHFKADALIVEFDLLHLPRIGAAGAVNNSVPGEIIVCGTLAEIAAVGLEFLSITVSAADGLIDKIPDKAALIERLAKGQVCIAVHAAAGIAHGMSVLAADKRLVPVFLQELLNRFRGRIHLALHIRCLRPGAVMENSLIVDKAVCIEGTESFRHVPDHRPSERLIAH